MKKVSWLYYFYKHQKKPSSLIFHLIHLQIDPLAFITLTNILKVGIFVNTLAYAVFD